jgi:hypothetical protein
MDNETKKVKTGETWSMHRDYKKWIKIVVTMSKEKRQLGRYRHKWKHNIKTYLKNTDCESVA